jgi:fibronectin-binding autotransporter adhesin
MHHAHASVSSNLRTPRPHLLVSRLCLVAAGFLGVREAVAQAIFTNTTVGGGNQDANVGLDTSKAYFNAINANGANLTINGVNFAGNNGDGTWSFANFPNTVNSPGSNASTITGQFEALGDHFRYGDVPATQSMTLTGLTPGQTYITTFYSPNWDEGNGTNRGSAISSTSGASGTYQQNGGSMSLLRHTFVASGTSETVSFNNTGAAGSTHLYGFTTEQAFNNNWTSGATWTSASWSVAQPNGVGDNANLPAQGSATALTLDAARTIGHLQFNGTSPWTLGGANALTLQADVGGASVLGAAAGSHLLATPLTLNSPVFKTGSGVLNVSGPVTGNSQTITVGAGTLRLQAGASPMLTDNFTATGNPNTADLNFNLSNRQTGSSALQNWTPSGNTQTGNPTPVQQPAGTNGDYLLLAFGASATLNGLPLSSGNVPGPLKVNFDMFKGNTGNSTEWTSFTMRSSGGNGFPITGSGEFGFLYRQNTGIQIFNNNGLLQDLSSTSGGDNFGFYLADSAGTGLVVTQGGSVIGSHLLNTGMGTSYLTFGSAGGMIGGVDNLGVNNFGTNPMSNGTPVSLPSSGGVFELDGVHQSIASLDGVTGSSVRIGPFSRLTVDSSTTTTFAGVISGTGTQVLSGINTYTGGTTVNGGTLQLNSGAGGAGGTLSGAGNIVVNNGGTLLGNAFNALGHSTGHPNDSITVNTGGNLRAGAGMVLSMPYDWNIIGGTVSSVDSGDPTHGSYYLDGSADYNFTSSGGGTAATLSAQRVNLVGAPRTFNVTDGPGAVDLNVTGTLIGNGGLTKSGAGTMVLSGANTYTGSTSFSGGIVNVANLTNYGVASSLGLRTLGDETPGGAGSISMIFRGGTLQYTGSTPQSTDRMIRISTTGGTIDASGTGAGTVSFTSATSVDQWENPGNRTLTLTGSNTGNNLFALGLADAGGQNSLVKSGTGKWVLSSNNATYAGATTINGGTLQVTGGNGIGNFSPLTLANTAGAQLVLSADEQIGSLNGGGASGGNVVLNGNTLSAGQNNISTVYSGLITGAGGSLVKNGSGTLELTNSGNSFTGKLGVHGGTLLLTGTSGTLGMGNPAAAPDAITLGQAGSAGTLHIAGGNLSPGAGRGITVAGVGATVDVDSGLTLSLDGNIAGGFVGSTFTKAGAGTFNLTGNATFNALAVRGGVYNQDSGNTVVLETSGTGLLVDTGVYNLNGGTLRADFIQTINGGTINWGSSTITLRQYGSGSNVNGDLSAKFNHTSPGYQNVKVGTSLLMDGGLATSAGSTVRLHGSPSFYLSSDVLFDNLYVDGNLDLTNGGTLEVEINPYLLRPFSPSGDGIETGSLPLVIASGGITGTFSTFTGVGNDGLGFSPFAGPFSGIGSLPDDTWYLEYRSGVSGSEIYLPHESGFAGTYDVVFFHYRVSGYVPEPGSFGLMVVGAYALRLARRRRA